jgi:SHS2 domain-containing protein
VYRWVEHTGELELPVEAQSPAGVFAEALAAFAELVGDGPPGEPARREIELEAADQATLLAEWLSELVYLAETQGLVPERVVGFDLAGTRMRAMVEGRLGQPPHLVKAVTYHGLEPVRGGRRLARTGGARCLSCAG